jgi:hypothetical protein
MISAVEALSQRLESPAYHEGSVFANRLGLQLARALAMKRKIEHARRASGMTPSRNAETLRRDGVLMIPDFLPAEVFRTVQQEYADARAAGLLEPPECFEDNGVIERRIRIGKHQNGFPVTRAALLQHEGLRELWSAVLGRHPESLSLIISVMSKADATIAPDRLIGSNYIHADVHFPTVKAWLYLNNVDEGNAAMTYARRSNQLTWARLAYEYEVSIRVAKAKKTVEIGRTVPYGRVRMPTPEQLARMGVREEPLCGRANTLVVADTMGFHRRGEFQDDRTRDLLMIRFNDRREKGAR